MCRRNSYERKSCTRSNENDKEHKEIKLILLEILERLDNLEEMVQEFLCSADDYECECGFKNKY